MKLLKICTKPVSAARRRRCMNAYLTEGFTVWGVTFQYWMPVAALIFVISMTALKEKL